MTTRGEFLLPAFVRKPLDAESGAAGLDCPSTEAGSAGNISVYYATSVRTSGETLANALLGLGTGPTATWTPCTGGKSRS
jgi:hypothetical protein